REHLFAGLDYQNRLARFLENHDEPRAAASFPAGMHEAAAIITFLSPGLRFFHQGQFEGRRKRISPHLVRAPQEPVDGDLERFYESLLAALRNSTVRDGQWQLLECRPAWEGNGSWDCFIIWTWQDSRDRRQLVVVNYAGHQSQCYVRLPFTDQAGHMVRLKDVMAPASYDRDGSELLSRVLYLDVPAWAYHGFDVTTLEGLPGPRPPSRRARRIFREISRFHRDLFHGPSDAETLHDQPASVRARLRRAVHLGYRGDPGKGRGARRAHTERPPGSLRLCRGAARILCSLPRRRAGGH